MKFLLIMIIQKPKYKARYPKNKAIRNPSPETINPSFLFDASKGKIPSPLVDIDAAINAARGKLGMSIKATATKIIPPQPGIKPITAAKNTTRYLDEDIHESNTFGPTSTSIIQLAKNKPIKTYVTTMATSKTACNIVDLISSLSQ